MRGDGNAIPLGKDSLKEIDTAVLAQAHALINRLPANILVAILPVLHKYSLREDAGTSPPPPDWRRITIHHPRRKR